VSRRPYAFKERDVVRAVRGAEAAGIKVARVDIEPNTGRISIVAAGTSTNDTELDRELAEFEGASWLKSI
jgi:hypothetical protein